MNGHDPQGTPSLALLPGHPVRDSPHLDSRQNRLAQDTPGEEIMTGTGRLVIAHVLVDRQDNACLTAEAHDFSSLGKIGSQGFMGQDAADMVFMLYRLADYG
jgi:hypothetical protein